MKQIKTAEEVYKQSWNLMANGELEKEPAIIHAMRTYAEQFINAAAEEILVDDSDDTNMKVILKLKEQLK